MAEETAHMAFDGPAFMRDLANARREAGMVGVAYQDHLAMVRHLTPELICPDCRGHGDGCSVCHYTGLVCPRCKSARWVLKAKGDSRSWVEPTIVACVVCMDHAEGEWSYNLGQPGRSLKEALAIQDALAAAWARWERAGSPPFVTIVDVEEDERFRTKGRARGFAPAPAAEQVSPEDSPF